MESDRRARSCTHGCHTRYLFSIRTKSHDMHVQSSQHGVTTKFSTCNTQHPPHLDQTWSNREVHAQNEMINMNNQIRVDKMKLRFTCSWVQSCSGLVLQLLHPDPPFLISSLGGLAHWASPRFLGSSLFRVLNFSSYRCVLSWQGSFFRGVSWSLNL